MTRLSLSLGAAIVLAVQSFISPTYGTEVVHFRSATSQSDTADTGASGVEDFSIWGHVSVPEGSGPHPAIVLLHGCAGIQLSHFRWASFLNGQGYLTLIPDSFSPRSIVNRCRLDAGPKAHPTRISDAFGALSYLQQRPDVDTTRIGLMGWSHGATMTLEIVRRQKASDQIASAFKTAITFYPYCVPDRRFDLPVLIMIGEADDWSPAAYCRDLASQNKQAGLVKLVTYPRAFHAFDLMEVADGFAAHGPNEMQYWVKFDAGAYQDSMFQVRAFLDEHLPNP